ncbi:MAG: BACON domain-containing protein, partial [Bacteroidales bacterium]|nr:BACON domain-containing protein [Bacteroidales bacterium]
MKTNIFKSAICLLIFTISFTSCKKQEKPFLTVDETPIEVIVTGGEYFITVKSNGEWTAMMEDAQNKDWCILGNNSGTGEGRVIVNIAENTDTLMRSAVVKITYGELVKSVLINQAGKTPFLTVDKASIEVVVSGGEYSFTVKSSGEWTAMVEDMQNKDWCTLDNNSGNGEGIVIVNITGNTDILMRSAVVKITSSELVKSVVINQAGLGSPFLTVDERFIMMKFGRDEQFITVKSNRAWTAMVENAQNRSWCTLSNGSGKGNGKITVRVAQNTESLM